MTLRPLRAATPPGYPSQPRRSAGNALRRAAATASAVAALWAGGCGNDGDCPTRLGGEAPPADRLGGAPPPLTPDGGAAVATPRGPMDGTSVGGPLSADLGPGDRPTGTAPPPIPAVTPPAKPPEPAPVPIATPTPPLPVDDDVPRLAGRIASPRR